jgi:hypothetical protein
LSDLVIETYEEVCQFVEQVGILPLSGFIPEHPSLDALTQPESWHTGAETDPWLWRDRLAADGIAAYGRFIAGKPVFIARELFPLMKGVLCSSENVEERYAAGLLSREAVQMYDLIEENAGIDVKALRKLAGMQHTSDKRAFDHALLDLQSMAEIVISGISGRLNAQGNKSGWNSTCYMLADRWIELHQLEPLDLPSDAARTQLFAWLEEHSTPLAREYLHKKINQHLR